MAAAGALAAADWMAVALGAARSEAVLKPLVPAVLALVPLTGRHWWFAAALALCLAGDVLLLPQVDRFRAGLAAFLLAHLAFIAGFLTQPLHLQRLGFAAGVLALVLALAPRIVVAAPRRLRPPVAAYVGVLVAMNVAALLAPSGVAAAGAGAFAVSDTLLAWNRFVGPLPGRRTAVMVTYHLALGLLTLSLALG